MIRIPRLELCLVMLLGLVCSQTSDAAIVTDQSQTSGTNALGTFNLGIHNVQSFQQTNNNITGASVGTNGIPAGAFITIRLFDMLDNVSNPTLSIASGTTTSSGASGTSLVHVDFVSDPLIDPPIFITSGVDYFLTFEKSLDDPAVTPASNSPTVPGAFLASLANPYANGQVYSNGTSFSNFDFVFQTFANDSAVAVPEPSTFAFLSVGLLGATIRRRRR